MPPSDTLPPLIADTEWKDKNWESVSYELPKSTRRGVRPTKQSWTEFVQIQSWTHVPMLGPSWQLQVQSWDLTKLYDSNLSQLVSAGEYQEKPTEIATPPVHKRVSSSPVSSTKQAWFWNAKVSQTVKCSEKPKPNIETVSLNTRLIVSFLPCHSHSLSNLQDLPSSLACAYWALHYCCLAHNKCCHICKNKVRFFKYVAKARDKAPIQKRQSASCWKSYKGESDT